MADSTEMVNHAMHHQLQYEEQYLGCPVCKARRTWYSPCGACGSDLYPATMVLNPPCPYQHQEEPCTPMSAETAKAAYTR